MRIVIVGGGNVGYYLVKTLVHEKHRIMLIDSNYEHCLRVINEFGNMAVEVTYGDGTDINCLRDSDIQKADVLIAVTGHDQNNLVACQLAKDYFGVKRTIARVTNPKNIRVFERLGVDSVISSTARIAGIIEQELDWSDVNALLSRKSANTRIREITVEKGAAAENKRIMELSLPKGIILISIIRGDEAIIPDGQTRIRAEDSVIAMGSPENLEQVIHRFSE